MKGLADPLKTVCGSHVCAPKIPVKETKSIRVEGVVVSSNDLKTHLKNKKASQKTKGWAGNRPGKGHNNPIQVQN